RHLGRTDEALAESALALRLDVLNYGALWERTLLAGEDAFATYTRGDPNTHVAIALDFLHAGLYDDAIGLLKASAAADPMVAYYLGYCYVQKGDERHARDAFRQAASLPPDYCFPHRLESVLALESAMAVNPADSRAPHYLGNFWYAQRRYDEAIACWEQARALDPAFATTHRNLGLAYFNKRGDA